MKFIDKATEKDVGIIKAIYQQAKVFMRLNGNDQQWLGDYPESEVESDLEKGGLLVLREEGDILAVMACYAGPDPTYGYIDGAWLSDTPYHVVHRMAVARFNEGIGPYCLQKLSEEVGELRADTHELNKPMQRMLEKSGFIYCGTIYLADGAPRRAYQKPQKAG